MRLWHTQKLLILMPMVHLLLTKALDIVQGELTAWQDFHNLVKDWNFLVTPWGKLVFIGPESDHWQCLSLTD